MPKFEVINDEESIVVDLEKVLAIEGVVKKTGEQMALVHLAGKDSPFWITADEGVRLAARLMKPARKRTRAK